MFFARALGALFNPIHANDAVTIAGSRIVTEILREFHCLSTEALWKHASGRGISSPERMELVIQWMSERRQICVVPAADLGLPGVSRIHMLPDAATPPPGWRVEDSAEDRAQRRAVRRQKKKAGVPRIFWDV